jgi:hypothetical protein
MFPSGKSPDVRLTLQGFERNQSGVLMALILVSNTGPHSLRVGTATGFNYVLRGEDAVHYALTGDERPLQAHTAGIWTVPVPTFGTSRATVMSQRVKSPLMKRVEGFIDRMMRRKGPKDDWDIHTLQIRE